MAFYNISREEMDKFLTNQGFKPMNLPNTRELVYGKIINHDGHKLSLRIYTAIEPTGESRKIGSDAIRVQLYWMYNDKPSMVGRTQKCLRVPTWAKNLQAAIDRHSNPEHFKTCPGCGSPMVIRESKGEEFWGCSTYHQTKCSGRAKPIGVRTNFATATKLNQTSSPVQKLSATPAKAAGNANVIAAFKNVNTFTNQNKSAAPQNPYRIADDRISSHQKAVENYFVSEGGNIIMGARAGSGKTTMLQHLSSFRPSGKSMIYLAFGKKNASEGKKKLPREVACQTTHSFCAGWLRDHYKLPEKSDQNKNWQIMEEIYPGMKNKDRRRIRKAAFRLVGLGKNFAIRPGDMAGLTAVMDQYSFELESDKETQTVLEVLEKSVPEKCGLIYDYDDMLWWPIIKDFNAPKYDFVLADECQDFNRNQYLMLMRMEAAGARIIAVGDPYQAVFRFRGADCDSYDKLKNSLGDSKKGCKEFVLPTNYRCGKAIIDYVRETTVVKDIEAAPNAIEGKVIEDMTYCDILDMLLAEHQSVV